MKRSNCLKIGALVLFSFLFVSTSYARGPSLPDIPDVFTEIFPADVDPDFEYNGLTPSCAASPGTDSEFSFFVKAGTVNKLVVYFQGGGGCWDSMNCLYFSTYSEEAPPVEAFADTTGRGIFDTNNEDNPFKDWYFVYVPYCTGDVHWGANDQVYPDYLDFIPGLDSWTIRHRGFVNFQLVLKWITDNFSRPRHIFVSGSSAGSYGAILAAPYIKEAYRLSRLSVVGDAGNGVTEPSSFQDTSILNWNIQIPDWIFPEGYTPDLTMADVYKRIAAEYPWSKFSQYTTAWDWNQTFFYNVMLNIMNPAVWETGWPAQWCEWHDQMTSMADETAAEAPNYRYYIAEGADHTIMMSPKFYTDESAGIPFVEWVRAMVRNPFGTHGPWLQGRWQNLECEDCADPVTCP